MAIQDKTEKAIEAIDELHSDTSVGQSTTLNELETVQEHLEMLIMALKETMED